MADLVSLGKRLDERGLMDYREAQVETGVVEKAEGSARVRLGKTEVLVGIKIGIGEPFSDVPNQGVLTVNAELVPLASPTFEPGPPGEDAIELARVVDRGIRESKAIDLENLCIEPGKKVFIVFIDLYVLNYDG
ncbi:MAG: RNA-binding protein, partial [Candidatus Bathyarchaeota archaeon]|nr:RNA-binding protein [Candidatus Bathyarchaeota archaeon]